MGGQTKDSSYLEGPFGRAWLAPPPPDHPNAITTVACWFLHLPNQGLGWDKFMLAVVTLADLPSRPPAKKRYPKAEYELLVAALDPKLDPRRDDIETWRVMYPLNVVEQFHGVTPVQAGVVARSCAAGCVTGRLMAETQMYYEPSDGSAPRMMVIKQLADLWTSAVAAAVDHERTGGLHARIN